MKTQIRADETNTDCINKIKAELERRGVKQSFNTIANIALRRGMTDARKLLGLKPK